MSEAEVEGWLGAKGDLSNKDMGGIVMMIREKIANMTQEEFAKKLNIKEETLVGIEAGKGSHITSALMNSCKIFKLEAKVTVKPK